MTRKVDRRKFIATGASFATLAPLGSRATAQVTYPTKPIRIVVSFPAGGIADITARTYAEYLFRQLGQPVVVENKPGGAGVLGAVELKRAPPDGYTLLCTISGTLVQNRVMIKDLPYDPDKDFTLIATLASQGFLLVASERTGASNLKEFIEYAKKSDKVSIGTYALGSPAHLLIAELNKQYGLNIEPVHYRGEAPMWSDVGTQALDAAIGSYNGALPMLQTGRGRALGATLSRRLARLPDLPTLEEQGAKSKLFGLRGFSVFLAPAGTPMDIVRKLSETFVAGGSDPKVKDRLSTFDQDPPIPYDASQKMYAEQTPLWLELMEGIGIKPE